MTEDEQPKLIFTGPSPEYQPLVDWIYRQVELRTKAEWN